MDNMLRKFYIVCNINTVYIYYCILYIIYICGIYIVGHKKCYPNFELVQLKNFYRYFGTVNVFLYKNCFLIDCKIVSVFSDNIATTTVLPQMTKSMFLQESELIKLPPQNYFI